MTAAVILTGLQASGVIFTVVAPDRLRVEAPLGVVTPELRSVLAQHKADIITELLGLDKDAGRRAFFQTLACQPDAWREFETQMEERAAIMEIDGALARDEAFVQAEIVTYENWIN